MKSFQINDLRKFTGILFLGDAFDNFFLFEAQFTTFMTFRMDGTLRKEFFPAEEQDTLCLREYAQWKDVRAYCFQIIKGKNLPLSFRVILRFPEPLFQTIAADSPISNLFLNLSYQNQRLVCSCGVSYRTFSLDRSPEMAAEQWFSDFLRKQGIDFDAH